MKSREFVKKSIRKISKSNIFIQVKLHMRSVNRKKILYALVLLFFWKVHFRFERKMEVVKTYPEMHRRCKVGQALGGIIEANLVWD